MRGLSQRYFFSVLVAVSLMSVHASSLASLRQSKEPAVSLKKCLKQLEIQKTDLDLSSLLSRKIASDEICSDIVEDLLNNFPSFLQHESEMRLGAKTDDAWRYSREHILSASDVDNSQDSNRAEGNRGKGATYRSGKLNAKVGAPKMKKNNSDKLADIRSTLSKTLSNRNGLDADISKSPEDLEFGKFAANVIQTVPAFKNALKPDENFLSKIMYAENLPSAYTSPKDTFNVGRAREDDEAIPFPDEAAPWGLKTQPSKRAPGNWLNVVSTEVAKRRRQTLSINNALMALTDMVLEHGREKLMRNRDNLRYHMYIQG